MHSVFEGLRDLDKVMKELPIAMRKRVVNEAAREGAKIIRSAMRDNVAVDEGITKKNISYRKTRKSVGMYHVGVKGIRGRIVHLIELGSINMPAQPFIRTAFDDAHEAAISAMIKRAQFGLSREARRLAGSFKESGL